MANSTFKNRVAQATATTGTGTMTLGAAESGYQALGAGDSGLSFDVVIVDGTAWEVARECVYSHTAGATLTRGTLEESSTGNAITLTGAAKVYITATADRIALANKRGRGHIHGLVVSFSTTTALAISSGSIDIDGELYTQASATTLSISTTNEIGAGTVAADDMIYVYALVSSGALAYKYDIRASSSEDPVWDADLGYWKHPSQAGHRFIGFWKAEEASANLRTGVASESERVRKVIFDSFKEILTVTGTTAGSVSLAGYVPPSASAAGFVFGANNQTSTAQLVQCHFSINVPGVDATNAHCVAKGYINAAQQTAFFGNNWVATNGIQTLYASGNATTHRARAFWNGAEYMV